MVSSVFSGFFFSSVRITLEKIVKGSFL